MTENENKTLIAALRKWSVKEPIFKTALDHIEKVKSKMPKTLKDWQTEKDAVRLAIIDVILERNL